MQSSPKMRRKPCRNRNNRVFGDIEAVRFVFAVEVAGGALEGCFFDVVVGIEKRQQWRDQQLQSLQASPVDQAAVTGQHADLRVTLGGDANGCRATVAGGENGKRQILHIAVLTNNIEQIEQALGQARHVLRCVGKLCFLSGEQFHGENRKILPDKICRNNSVDRSMMRTGEQDKTVGMLGHVEPAMEYAVRGVNAEAAVHRFMAKGERG